MGHRRQRRGHFTGEWGAGAGEWGTLLENGAQAPENGADHFWPRTVCSIETRPTEADRVLPRELLQCYQADGEVSPCQRNQKSENLLKRCLLVFFQRAHDRYVFPHEAGLIDVHQIGTASFQGQRDSPRRGDAAHAMVPFYAQGMNCVSSLVAQGYYCAYFGCIAKEACKLEYHP